jgi:AcrR family transcriptional regulator
MPKAVDVDERRFELATAAARVIARAGLGGATMREVAAEAGWTTGALTHYFADKRELLQFTLEMSLEGRRAQGVGRRELPPDAALRAALVAALPFDEQARLHWIVTVAFCAHAVGDAELAEIQRDAYRVYRDDIAALVACAHRARGTGAMREAERLIALADGVALQALFDPESWPAARQLAVIDDALDARSLR